MGQEEIVSEESDIVGGGGEEMITGEVTQAASPSDRLLRL